MGISLVLATAGDIPQIASWMLTERFLEFSQYTPLASYALRLEEKIHAMLGAEKTRLFLLKDATKHKPIGDLGFVFFTDIDPYRQLGEVSIFSANGRLPLLHVSRAVFSLAFNELGLRKLRAEVLETHVQWISVLKRLGFRVEGHIPRKVFRSGRSRNTVLLAIHRNEWQGGGKVR